MPITRSGRGMDWSIAKHVEVDAVKNPQLSFHSVNILCERHSYLLTERGPNFVQPLRNYPTNLLIGFGNALSARHKELEEERKGLKTVEERYDHDAVTKKVEEDLTKIDKVVNEREREIARMVGMEPVAVSSDKDETDDDLPGLEDSTPPTKNDAPRADGEHGRGQVAQQRGLSTDGEIKTEKVSNTIEFAVEGLTDGDTITMTINEDKDKKDQGDTITMTINEDKDKKDQGGTITMVIAEDNKKKVVEDLLDERPHSALILAGSDPDPSRGDEPGDVIGKSPKKVVVIPADLEKPPDPNVETYIDDESGKEALVNKSKSSSKSAVESSEATVAAGANKVEAPDKSAKLPDVVPAQEAGGEAKEAAPAPQEKEEEEKDGVKRVRPSSLAVARRRVTPEPPVSPGDKMHSNVQSLLSQVHEGDLFEQLKKQIPFCGCGADLCSRCLSICRRQSRMHLNYLRLCVKKRPMSRIFELGNSPLTRPIHPDAIIVGDIGENGKPIQIFEPDSHECLHVCNILFVQYVLPDILRLLEYIRETEAVVTTIIKDFLVIFAENRMSTLMSYDTFLALNDECPQSKQEEFRSCIDDLVEQWIMQRGPKCLYGQHDAGIMLLKPLSLRGYSDTMGCIDRSRMKRKSDKAEIADQKKGKQTSSEASKAKSIPRETLV